MALFTKVGNMLRKTACRRIGCESSVSSPSIYQAIRCMSSSKLFIGGISYSMDENSLREAFAKYGCVNEARIIMDRETGRSRGFGFVTFSSVEEASSAIQALDGQDLHGRRVRVNYAADKPRGDGYGGGGYGGGGFGGGGYGGSGGGYGGGYGGNSGGYGGNTGGYGSGSGNIGVAGGAGGADGGFNGITGFGNFLGGSGGIDTGFDRAGGLGGGDGGIDAGFDRAGLGGGGAGLLDDGFDGAGLGGSDGSSSSMGGATGGFDQDEPVDGNFRDEDDTGDFAKRA